jgi:30S ribosomal protein 3
MLQFKIRILWLKNKLGIAVDQIYEKRSVPLTGYYFWPRNDAWELIRLEINSKMWINDADKIYILNQITQILNRWKKNAEDSKIEVLSAEYKEINFTGMQ